MKKYALYPGVGKTPDYPHAPSKVEYITPKMLAFYFRVPFSECVNMDDTFIKKVAAAGAKFDQLVPLLPSLSGKYVIPKRAESKLILAAGLQHEVNKNG